RLQQVVGRDASLARLALHGDQADAVAAPETNFRRVLDEDHALMLRDLSQQSVKEGRLAARRAARDEDRRIAADGLPKKFDVARSLGMLVPWLHDIHLGLARASRQRNLQQPGP